MHLVTAPIPEKDEVKTYYTKPEDLFGLLLISMSSQEAYKKYRERQSVIVKPCENNTVCSYKIEKNI